ncbi:outer membrane beta-barrel protein [Microbulbifer sp. CnH-101-G]|uniref:outer membrane beta-barrel protein n=1 Tax=Microbulbifer sp. CnH-101-G TaxID=3243393 RepID=UPI00403975E6
MKQIALTALVALVSTNVYAEEKPFYLKASLGYMHFDSEDSTAVKEDLNSTGYAFTFGYRVNDYIAFEGGMANLGDIRKEHERSVRGLEWYYSDDEILVENYDYQSKQETKYKSYNLGLALSSQIQQNLNAGIRFGVHQWCANDSGRAEHSGNRNWYSLDRELLDAESFDRSYSWSSNKNSGSNPYYGAEVNWTTGDWGINLEHTIYEIQDEKANLSSVGVTYSF